MDEQEALARMRAIGPYEVVDYARPLARSYVWREVAGLRLAESPLWLAFSIYDDPDLLPDERTFELWRRFRDGRKRHLDQFPGWIVALYRTVWEGQLGTGLTDDAIFADVREVTISPTRFRRGEKVTHLLAADVFFGIDPNHAGLSLECDEPSGRWHAVANDWISEWDVDKVASRLRSMRASG